jgi:hypothetical protein
MHCMAVLIHYIGDACAYAYYHKHCMSLLIVMMAMCKDVKR